MTPRDQSGIHVVSEERRCFFTERTLAEYLALSPRTVRDMLKRGMIASYKIGGARRISPVDVDQFLAEHRKEAA